jgi:hypothetical protein
MHQHNKELIIVEERNKTGKNKLAATDIKPAISHGIAQNNPGVSEEKAFSRYARRREDYRLFIYMKEH